MHARVLTVFGSGTVSPGSAAYETARDVGRCCAECGWVLCNGGYGGTMEATARGARQAGGYTIGVTCAAFGRGPANRWIVSEISMPTLLKRVGKLIELGNAYLVLPGETGTLVELALVWEQRRKGLVEAERPLMCYGDFWRPVVQHVVPASHSDTAAPLFIDGIDALRGVLHGCCGG